jgi:hypothetical protein
VNRGRRLFGSSSGNRSLLSANRRALSNQPGTSVVLGSESKGRQTTDVGRLLGKPSASLGIATEKRSPIDLLNAKEQFGEIPLDVARQAGRFVAQFDSECGRELARSLDPVLCTGEPPWILSYHLDQGDGWLSPANTELLRILKSDPVVTAALDEIRTAWRTDSLMHTDLKWNNVLAVPGKNGQWECRVVDWEMVNRGDPAWDAATMLQSWWWHWVLSTPPHEITTLDAFIDRRRGAFEESRPSLEAFWSGCIEEVSPDAAHDWLERCAHLGAARLLQTAYEQLQTESVISDSVRLLIDLSRRFLTEPESALPFSPHGESGPAVIRHAASREGEVPHRAASRADP